MFSSIHHKSMRNNRTSFNRISLVDSLGLLFFIFNFNNINFLFHFRIQFNSEEQWTKALKFLLTNLKWGLAWVSSQFTKDENEH